MNAKKAAAYQAVEAVQNNTVVGLGTGTTAYYAIEKLGDLVRNGLRVKAVGSSVATEDLARKAGIEIVDFATIQSIDVYIDGADEVDAAFNLIKGGGGALVREKIVASNSNAFIVIVDSSKQVSRLGRFPLPVEVLPFAMNLTLQQLQKLGAKGTLRERDEKIFISDNGNYIIDLQFGVIDDPVALNAAINIVPGVVESGLFPGSMVTKIIVGHDDGQVSVINH